MLATIMPLLTFDFLFIDKLNEPLFNFEELDLAPLSSSFEIIGYEQTLVVMNLGDKLYLILFSPLIVLLLRAMKWFTKCSKCRRTNKILQQQWQGLLWNGVIDFLYANYFIITIAVLIQFKDPRFTSEYHWTEKMNCYINIIFAVGLLAYPIGLTILFAVKLKRVEPYPELDSTLPVEDIKAIYGHTNAELICFKMYTTSKHE